MIYLRLFYEFFKAGLFAIGGGMATVPFLQDISQNTGWYTSGELADMIAISQSTPGPMGVNMATYVGYTVGHKYFGQLGGVLGAFVSTFALILPSVIIIMIVAKMLEKFRDNKYVNAALYGLRPASVAMITSAGIVIILFSFFQINNVYEFGKAVVDYRSFILAAVVLVCSRFIPFTKKLHPILFIIASGIVGIIFHMSVV
ncbi:MAG: chromate transporter [Lachnospiraceae bacterium]|nr:chromate transporter [Lachnospiraceae bacterium]